MTAKLEALTLGIAPSSLTSGQQLDFNVQVPLNILSMFRSSQANDSIVSGVVVPNLALASMAYRFTIKQDAQQTATLRGDSIFYTPGPPQEDAFIWDGTLDTITLGCSPAHADPYYNPAVDNDEQYVLNFNFYNTDGSYGRLFNGAEFDYTDTDTTVSFNTSATLVAGSAVFASGMVMHAGATIRLQYSSIGVPTTVSAAENTADGTIVKPAAVRPYDIQVYFQTGGGSPVWNLVPGVQSVDATWTATGMEQNWEFGNALAVSIDFVVPAFAGTVTVRPNTVQNLLSILAQTANVSAGHVIGALTSSPIPMACVISSPGPNPTVGSFLKTLYTVDAHFDPPDLSSRVNQKIDLPFAFQSDTGSYYTYNKIMAGLPGS